MDSAGCCRLIDACVAHRVNDRTPYQYVGPQNLLTLVSGEVGPMNTVEDLQDALKVISGTNFGRESSTVTFVVGLDGLLRVADRHSEHVACAGGKPILSAGEMTFNWENGELFVENVTNQSTGYCPEPESWPYVQQAIKSIGLRCPDRFEPELIFRRCPKCDQTNLVKDSYFYCAVCNSELPEDWNFL